MNSRLFVVNGLCRGCMLALSLSIAHIPFINPCIAQEARSVNSAASIQLSLKASAQVASNIVKLSDLIDTNNSRGLNENLLALPLSPSPAKGAEQLWTRATVESLLKLKGIQTRTLTWVGPEECKVVRSNQVSMPIDNGVTTAVAYSNGESQVVQAVSQSTTERFVATQINEQSTSLSQRHAVSAIQSYLRTVSDSDFDYEIKVDIPAEGIEYLRTRSNIVAVSGGSAPWVGQQRFVLQTKSRDQITNIEVGAIVELPTRVVATNRNLGKDHIISAADLRLIVLPKSSRVEPSVCFTDVNQVIGKQLRRTLATGQAIESNHIGSPRLVEQNDEVEIQVSAAGLMVSTRAKALQGGGLNDLIVVEVLPQRSKVTARVTAAGVVSAIAQ